MYKTPEEIKTKGRGKNGKALTCYTLVHEFKPYFDLWMKDREEKGIQSQWLFPKKINGKYVDEPMNVTTLDSWAKTFTKMLDGIPFYFHSLRHFFTTSLSEIGLPDAVIQLIIGWGSADMVKIYKDISTDEELGKYFDENGIKEVKQVTLSDL